MKIFILSFILFLFVGCQKSSKPKADNYEIKALEQKREIGLKNGDYFTEEDSLFLVMVNKKIITKPEEKKYISRLDNLIPIQLIHCDNNSIHYKDSINGKSIELKLSLKKFDKEKHSIKKNDYEITLVDNKNLWGGHYGLFKEIDQIEILINERPTK